MATRKLKKDEILLQLDWDNGCKHISSSHHNTVILNTHIAHR